MKIIKVLIVEDKEENRKAALSALDTIEIIFAETGEEAKTILQKGGIEKAILDLHLPVNKNQTPTKEVGVELAEMCEKLHISYVICTAQSHDANNTITKIYDSVKAIRGDKQVQSLFDAAQELPRKIVYADKNQKKPWQTALEILEE